MIQPLLVFSDTAIAVLRVVVEIILFAHGMQKVRGWKGAIQGFGAMGFKPAVFWLGIVTALEVGGGALLILGLLTQVIAVLVAIEFIVIILKVKLRQSLIGGFELDLLVLAAALILATVGGGAYDLDAFLGILVY